MSGNRVCLAGDAMTHEIAWADNVAGYTYCGLDFKWGLDDTRSNAFLIGTVAEQECDCMTCLVRSVRKIGFMFYENAGVSVINVNAIDKINFNITEKIIV